MTTRNSTRLLIAVIMLAIANVASAQSAKQPVTIDNMTPAAATIFLVAENGSETRIGEVQAYSVARLGVSEHMLTGRISFRVRYLAGATIRTESVPVTLPALITLKLTRTEAVIKVRNV